MSTGIALHLLASLAIAAALYAHPTQVVAVISPSFFIAQTSLIGIWFALGRRSPLCLLLQTSALFILPVLLANSFAAEAALSVGARPPIRALYSMSVGFIAACFLGVIATLVPLRWRGRYSLRLATLDDRLPASGLQLSIAHLFAIVSLAAVVCAMVNLRRTSMPNRLHDVAAVVLLSVSWSTVAAMALWSTLGVSPIRRIPMALGISMLLGLMFPLAQRVPIDDPALKLVPAVFAGISIVCSATLLVARCNGYRIVREQQVPSPMKEVESRSHAQ